MLAGLAPLGLPACFSLLAACGTADADNGQAQEHRRAHRSCRRSVRAQLRRQPACCSRKLPTD